MLFGIGFCRGGDDVETPTEFNPIVNWWTGFRFRETPLPSYRG